MANKDWLISVYTCLNAYYNSCENEVKDINNLHDNKNHISKTFTN